MKLHLGYFSLMLPVFSIGPVFAEYVISSNELPTSINIPQKIPIEECSKKRNVIVYGIPAECQQRRENLTQAVFKVLQLAKVTLPVSEIKMIRKLGSTVSRSTAVLVTFASEEVKRYVFSHKAYLYGTGYKMELDLPKIISYRYRILKPLYDRLVQKGADVTLVYGKLFINGNEIPDHVAEKYLFSSTTKSRTLQQYES